MKHQFYDGNIPKELTQSFPNYEQILKNIHNFAVLKISKISVSVDKPQASIHAMLFRIQYREAFIHTPEALCRSERQI